MLQSTVTPNPAHVRGKTLYVRISEWVMGLTYVAVLVISALMLYYLYSDGDAGAHKQVFSIAGICVALTLPLSIHDIHMHCVHYVSPLQKYYVRCVGSVVRSQPC